MKKIIYLLFVFGINLFHSANCQTERIVDLRVRIISPLKNSYLKSPGTVDVKFSVINKGPNILKPSDTIVYYPKSNDTLFKFKRVFTSKIIQPGDSEVFTALIPYSSPYDQNYYVLAIVGLGAYNRSNDFLKDEPINTQNDNSSSITVRHRSATSGIDLINFSKVLQISPNPANDYVNIQFEKNNDISRITVADLQGKILKDFEFLGKQNFVTLPTEDLETGVYFITCNGIKTSICSKLVILH